MLLALDLPVVLDLLVVLDSKLVKLVDTVHHHHSNHQASHLVVMVLLVVLNLLLLLLTPTKMVPSIKVNSATSLVCFHQFCFIH